MGKEKFSFYRPRLTSVIPVDPVSLDDVWELITDTSLKVKTDHLRELLANGKGDQYKKEKGDLLPSATFGGVFDYRNGDPQKYRETLLRKLETETDPKEIDKITEKVKQLEGKTGLLSYSGFMIVDVDHLSEIGTSPEELKEILSEDEDLGVRLVFVSPSGDGVKLVCKIGKEIPDITTYKQIYKTLLHYLSEKYNLPIGTIGLDTANSDVTRTCLLPYDPTAKILDWDSVFDPDLHPLPEEKIDRGTPLSESRNWDNMEDGIEEIIKRVEKSGVDVATEYEDYRNLGYLFANVYGGEQGLNYYKRVCKVHINRNGQRITDKEIEDQYNRCKGGTGDKGTFIKLCKRAGINVYDYNNKRGGLPYTPGAGYNMETEYKKTETAVEEKTGNEYDYLLEIPEIKDIVSQKREGIKTKYLFGRGRGTESLTLRSGAITLICGKSSHGKSKLLQNLALSIAKDQYNSGEDGDVLFFSYEEELSAVLLQFANIYNDKTGLSKYDTDNIEVLRDYFVTGDLPRCVKDKKEGTIKNLVSFNTLYKSGKLRVFYSDLSSEKLCTAIKTLSQKIKIKAIFVDYVQLLTRDKGRKERREEIKDICNDLRATAIDTGLPIILAGQLNRETPNPTDMSEDNIADSADLTRYANTIVCLWNSVFDNVKGGRDNYLQTDDGGKLQKRGFNLGTPGQIYAKITKNRGGSPYIDGIFTFRGETGKIEGIEDLPVGEEEKTGTISGGWVDL